LSVIPSQNGLALKKSERAGDTPMVNMGEMFKGEVISTDGDYERVTVPTGSKLLLQEGDLLFARRSIVFEGAGMCCLVPALVESFTFESSVIRTQLDTERMLPEFVLHYFRSRAGRMAMSQIVRRGPVSGVSGSDLRLLAVPVPPISEQKMLVDRITAAGHSTPTIDQRLQSATTLVRSLLVDIFGGQ
jgi:type I restriction enzyme S subunit